MRTAGYRRVRPAHHSRPALDAEPEIAMRMIRVLVSRLIDCERRLAVLGADDLLRPVVRVLTRRAEPSDQYGMRVPLTLRGLAGESGLSLYRAHQALHQLLDRKLVHLIDDTLFTPDLEALSACLPPQNALLKSRLLPSASRLARRR